MSRGLNDTQALIGEDRVYNAAEKEYDLQDRATNLNAIKNLNVSASDNSNVVTGVIGAAVSKKAAVGGGAAYSGVGGIGGGRAQQVAAQVNNANITTKNDAVLNVMAEDKSVNVAAAIGAAVSGNAGVEGAAASSVTHKQVDASMENSSVNSDSAEENNAGLTLNAESTALNITNATAIAVGKSTAIGAGVAVSDITASTTSGIRNSSEKKYNVGTLLAKSNSDQKLYTIGLGGGVAKTAGVAGNVAINLIDNDTTATIDKANIVAQKDIGALALSRDKIGNYAGTLGLAAGGQAGVGISLAYNQITGDTASLVRNSSLSAKGGNGFEVRRSGLDNNKIFGLDMPGLGLVSESQVHKGIAIEADAQHDINNYALNGAVAVSGSVGVGVSAEVVVNRIDGATKAQLLDSSADANNADINVLSTDATDLDSFVGALAVGIGADTAGVGVSAANDTTLVSRDVSAVIDGDTSNANSKKKVVNANNINVDAKNHAALFTSADGVAVAVAANLPSGAVAAGASAVSVKQDSETTARVDNVNTTSSRALDIKADHMTDVQQLVMTASASGAAIGAAAALSVGVVDDDSNTTAALTNSDIKVNKGTGANNEGVSIEALDDTTIGTGIVGVAGSLSIGAGGAVNLSVNNLDNQVNTIVDNTKVVTNGMFKAKARNDLSTSFNNAYLSAGTGAAVAAGVSVNTVDTAVVTDIERSNIEARSLDISTHEDMDVNSNLAGAMVGGMSTIGANVSVLSIGAKAQDKYTSEGKDSKTRTVDIGSVIDRGNAVKKLENEGYGDYIQGVMNDNNLNLTNDAQAGLGKSGAEGLQTKVVNSALTATGGDVALTTEKQVDTDMMSAMAEISGGANFGISVAVADVDGKNGITAQGSSISGQGIKLEAKQGGKSEVNAYQAAGFAMADLSGTYTRADMDSETAITVSNTGMTASQKDIVIKAEDTSSGKSNAFGATVNLMECAGAIVAQADNESTVAVNISAGSDKALKAAKNIDIDAVKQNKVEAKAIGGVATLGISAQGLAATANDKGSANINVSGNHYKFEGKAIDLSALNAPSAKAEAYNVAAAGAAAAQVSVSKAAADATAQTIVADGNTFTAPKVSFQATVGDGENNSAYAKTLGVSAVALGVGVAANVAKADTNTQALVDIGRQTYAQDTTELTIKGSNKAMREAHMDSVTIGLWATSGNGTAVTNGNDTASVSANGTTNRIKSADIEAEGDDKAKSYSNGDGGSAVDVSPVAALADNQLTSSASARIGGTWNVKDAMNVKALQTDTSDVYAEAIKLGAAVFAGAGSVNQVKSAGTGTLVDFASGSNITAGSLNAQAKNTVYTGKDYNHALDVAVNGLVAGGAYVSAQTVNKQAQVNAAGTITTQGSQTLAAESDGQLNNKVWAESAGLADITVVTAKSDTTFTNKVVTSGTLSNIGKMENGDITLSAHDDNVIKTEAEAVIPTGIAAGVGAMVQNTLTRTNSVDMGGTVSSARDLNIYAGRDASGEKGMLDMDLAADIYNHAAIPIDKPNVSNTVKENYQVNVKGQGSAAQHVNVTANPGKTDILMAEDLWTWNRGQDDAHSFVGNDHGVPDYGQTADNFINLAGGKLTAGRLNSIDIAIKGTALPEGYKLSNGSGSNLTYTVKVGDGSDKSQEDRIRNGIEVSEINIANSYYERYQELCKLIDEYSNGTDTSALLGFIAEREALLNQMQAQGMLGDNGGVEINGSYVQAVQLPALSASGGNITLETDNVKGNGSLIAKGAPQITVTNESTAYLRVGDISLGEEGGQVSVIDAQNIAHKVNSSAELDDFNKNTSYKYNGSLNATATTGAVSSVTITNDKSASVEVTNGSENLTFVPVKTVEVNGNITNPHGNIIIENKGGDILVNQGNVNGKSIALKASGNVMQGFSNQLVNIGGDPKGTEAAQDWSSLIKQLLGADPTKNEQKDMQLSYDAYNCLSEALHSVSGSLDLYFGYMGFISSPEILEGSLDFSDGSSVHDRAKAVGAIIALQHNPYLSTESKKTALSYAENVVSSEEAKAAVNKFLADNPEVPRAEAVNARGGTIAGGNVYIAANDINVNGLIQSGFDSYKATITQEALNEAKNNGAIVTVGNKNMRKVNDGGKSVLQDDGSYVYIPQIYYDASDNSLVVEDIDVQGGNIYLTGRIASTGGGQIKALDGGAKIEIDNQTNATLNLGRVLDNDVTGKVTIMDTSLDENGNMHRTEYTRNQTITTVVDKTGHDGNQTTAGATGTYQPKETLRYAWAEGVKNTTETKYTVTTKKKWWGAGKANTWEDVKKQMEEAEIDLNDVQGQANKYETSLPSGIFLADTSQSGFQGLAAEREVSVVYQNVVTDSPVVTAYDVQNSSSGFLGFNKESTVRWTTKQGSVSTYVYSIAANKEIGIDFFGQDNADISIKGNGDVNLNGDIQAAKGTSKLFVTAGNNASSGAVTQKDNTAITASNVDLNAKTGINNIQINSLTDTVALKADTASGNIGITVSGGMQDGKKLAGAVQQSGITTDNGNVSLTADGNITNQFWSAKIAGKRIDLVSKNGSIGTDEMNPVKLNAGTTPDGSDPLSASVNASARNDIYLDVSGDMRIGTISSTDGDVTLNSSGYLVDALPAGERVQNADIDARIQRWVDAGLIAAEGSETSEYKEAMTRRVAAYEQDIRDNFSEYEKLSDGAKEKFKAQNTWMGNFTTAEAWLNAQKQDSSSDYAKMLKERDNKSYEWEREKLLYAIDNAILNKATGSTISEKKAPNISGRNVTLDAHGVGVDNTTTTEYDASRLTIDDLKQLSNAEAADVTVTRDSAGNVEKFIVGGKSPLGINATGKLKITTKGARYGNIYVASRSNNDVYAPIQLDQIITGGEVRLHGKSGVTNGRSDDAPNVKAASLILEGGSQDIGATDKYVTVQLTGDLVARTEKSSYIKNVSNNILKLGGSFAGDRLSFLSQPGFAMTDMAGNSGAVSYLNAGKQLDLLTDGSIGTAEKSINVLANDEILNVGSVTAGRKLKDVYLNGVLGGLNVDTSKLVIQSIDAAGTVVLKSAGDIELKDGTVSAAELEFEAQDGSITQSDTSRIVAADMAAAAKDGISLMSGANNTGGKLFNEFTNLKLKNTNGGKVEVGNNSSHDWNVTLLDSAANTGLKADGLFLHNYQANSSHKMSVTGTTALHAENVELKNDNGDLDVNVGVESSGSVSMTAKGSLTNRQTIAAENGSIALEAQDGLTNDGSLTGRKGVSETSANGYVSNAAYTKVEAAEGAVTMTAGGTLFNQAAVTAQKSVNMTAGNGLRNTQTVTSEQGGIDLTGKNDVMNSGTLTGKKRVSETSANGDVLNAANTEVEAAEGAVVMTAGGTLENHAAVTAQQSVNMTAGEGLVNTQAVTSEEGSIDLTAKNDVTNNGSLTGKKGVSETSANGDVSNAANTEVKAAEGAVEMKAGGTLENNAAVTAQQSVNMTAGAGLKNTQAVTSEEGSIALAGQDGVTNGGSLTGKKGVSETSANGNVSNGANTKVEAAEGAVEMKASGTLENHAAVTAQQSVNMTAGKGLMNTQAVISEQGGIDLTSKNDVMNSGTLTAQEDISMKSEEGSITNTQAVASEQGGIDLTGETGVTNNADLTAKTGINEKAATGDIVNAPVPQTGDEPPQTGDEPETVPAGIKLQAENGNVEMEADSGNINNDAAIESGGAVKMSAGKDVMNSGMLSAQKDISMKSEEGSVTNTQAVTSEEGGIDLTGETGVTNNADLTAKTGISEKAATGDIVNAPVPKTSDEPSKAGDEPETVPAGIKLQAEKGNVEMEADSGNINNSAAIESGGAVKMSAGVDLTNEGSVQGTNAVELWAEGKLKNTGGISSKYNYVTLSGKAGVSNSGMVRNRTDVPVTPSVGKKDVPAAGKTDVPVIPTAGETNAPFIPTVGETNVPFIPIVGKAAQTGNPDEAFAWPMGFGFRFAGESFEKLLGRSSMDVGTYYRLYNSMNSYSVALRGWGGSKGSATDVDMVQDDMLLFYSPGVRSIERYAFEPLGALLVNTGGVDHDAEEEELVVEQAVE